MYTGLEEIMSLLFGFVFFGAFCARYGSSLSEKGISEKDFALHFPNKGVTDYATVSGMPTLTQFTVCFWIKTTEKYEASPFSYATETSYTGNELFIKITGSHIEVNLNNEISDARASVNDGKWHHVCTSWENGGGFLHIYKDGKLENTVTDFRQGRSIKGGGVITLGQDQDKVGGGFDSKQSLKGYLANLNVWSRVLPPNEIMAMSNSCLQGEGDVCKWSDFKRDVRGNTEVVSPSPCQPLQG